MCPCRALDGSFFFFSPKMWGLSRPKYSQKYKNPNIWRKKKHSLKARQGHIEQVCKISGSNSQKRRGHWPLKEFAVLWLNQPVGQPTRVFVFNETKLIMCWSVCSALSNTAIKWTLQPAPTNRHSAKPAGFYATQATIWYCMSSCSMKQSLQRKLPYARITPSTSSSQTWGAMLKGWTRSGPHFCFGDKRLGIEVRCMFLYSTIARVKRVI